MLEQLDRMQVSTPIFPALSSYCIGPIDPTLLITLQGHLTAGQDIPFSFPARFPSFLLTDPNVKDGYQWGYTETDPEEEWTVPKLINRVYATLTCERFSKCSLEPPDYYPWTLGFLLGTLSYLLEVDRPLALSGLAHYQYLLTLLPIERTPPWPLRTLLKIRCFHHRSLKAYRAQVRFFRQEGKSFDKAQRLALVESAQ